MEFIWSMHNLSKISRISTTTIPINPIKIIQLNIEKPIITPINLHTIGQQQGQQHPIIFQSEEGDKVIKENLCYRPGGKV